MSSFTTNLIISPHIDGKHWKLIEKFRYRVGNMESKDIISVPAGFVTDFASVPRIFWSIFPPWGGYGKATILHDYLYLEKKRTKKESDLIFLEAMEVLEVRKLKRKIMYLAVRIFGCRSWNKKKFI